MKNVTTFNLDPSFTRPIKREVWRFLVVWSNYICIKIELFASVNLVNVLEWIHNVAVKDNKSQLIDMIVPKVLALLKFIQSLWNKKKRWAVINSYRSVMNTAWKRRKRRIKWTRKWHIKQVLLGKVAKFHQSVTTILLKLTVNLTIANSKWAPYDKRFGEFSCWRLETNLTLAIELLYWLICV